MLRIGIDVGGTKVAVGIFDVDMKLLHKFKLRTIQGDAEALCREIAAEIREKTADLPMETARIGVGIPGTVDFETGRCVRVANLLSLNGFDIAGWFERELGIKTKIDNDANLAALAEHRMGAGRGFENMIYSTISTGLGGGLIINGELFHGSYGNAGEIGHMIITENEGNLCGCGNRGCFESHAAGGHIHELITHHIENGEATVLADEPKRDGEALGRALAAGDAVAEAVLDEMCRYIGLLYYNLFQMLNINCYVMGGGLSNLGEPFFERVKNAFYSFTHGEPPIVYFKKAELGQDFGIIGAALLAE